MNIDQTEAEEALNDLDSFMFLAEHDNRASQQHEGWVESSAPTSQEQSSDPLDGLFSYPVQEYLMREETPEKATSASMDLALLKHHGQRITSCDRVLSGLHSLSSVEIPPDLLSDSEGPGEHFDLPIIDEEDANHSGGSLKNKRKQSSQFHAIPAPYSGHNLRKRSREVPTIPPPKRVATRASSRSSTMKKNPKMPAPSVKKVKVSSSRAARNSDTKQPARKKMKARKSQATAVVDAPDHEVSEIRLRDVLFGKGGKINKHKGNLEYHQEKKKLQAEYLGPSTSKARKRDLVCQLYNTVVHDWGGRFLRRGDVDEGEERWYEAHEEAALEKCRQALATPERTKEERAARRRMFIEKRKKRLGKK